ncbi:MAG TPA: PAS domain S-box protein [Gammaproteobacteria bacterium]|nr:PAS domain S-box protein [Gammaproteobacteria bacterium]
MNELIRMNPANSTNTLFNNLFRFRDWSVRRKISVGFGGLLLLMTLGLGITLLTLNNIKRTAASAIELRQPAANYFQRLSQSLNQSIALINGYLLTGEAARKAEFITVTEDIADRMEGVRQHTVFQGLQLEGIINTSQALFQQFRAYADELFELYDNNQINRGLIIANEKLNTQAIRFLTNINILLASNNIDGTDPKAAQALPLLEDLRYNWVRMMWTLSLYVNNPTQVMMENFKNFNERSIVLMEKLLRLNPDIGFGELEDMQDAYTRYQTELPGVLKIFQTDEWRADTHLLRTQVQPVTDQLQKIFEKTADQLLESAFENGQELTQTMYQTRISTIVFMTLGLLTGALLAITITRGIVPPIQRLMIAAGQVAEGDLNAEVMVTSRDEIGQLGNSFNTMTTHLRAASMKEQEMLEELQALNQGLEKRVEERTRELESSETKIRAILDNIGEGIIVIDEQGKIESMNPAAERIFSFREADAIGLNAALLIAISDDDGLSEREEYSDLTDGIFKSSDDRQPHECQGQRSDGSTFPLEFVVSTMNVDGKLLRVCILRDVTARKETEASLAEAQNQLVDAAHKSGMADMATGVLHNIGNILNSVNLSGEEIQRTAKNSKIAGLLKANDLLLQHQDNMGEFLTQDARGKKLPDYYIKMGKVLNDEIDTIKQESQELIKKTTMMKEVINTQQAYAKTGFHSEQLNLPELIEDALKIQQASLKKWGVRLTKEYADTPPCTGQKSKLLQVITNLIKNAKEAMNDNDQFNRPKELVIETGTLNNHAAYLKVKDNGCGISPDQLNKIFNHGFTTKESGHGFGLHSSANAMTEMHGSLKVDSDGVQKGACFTVTIPIEQST